LYLGAQKWRLLKQQAQHDDGRLWKKTYWLRKNEEKKALDDYSPNMFTDFDLVGGVSEFLGGLASPIVIDNGSCFMKAGTVGKTDYDPYPQTIFTSQVGKPVYPCGMIGIGQKSCYVGSQAQTTRGILALESPINRGIISNWDGLEKLWRYVFYEALRQAPEEHPVLLTEACLSPHMQREKMIELIFEQFEVVASYVALQGVWNVI